MLTTTQSVTKTQSVKRLITLRDQILTKVCDICHLHKPNSVKNFKNMTEDKVCITCYRKAKKEYIEDCMTTAYDIRELS